MYQNWPNPIKAGTTITYDLAKPEIVKLIIFDVLGRQVSTLENKRKAGGKHFIHWDGRSGAGNLLPNGMYWLRMQVGCQASQKQILLLR